MSRKKIIGEEPEGDVWGNEAVVDASDAERLERIKSAIQKRAKRKVIEK